jgi:hypothetical protein
MTAQATKTQLLFIDSDNGGSPIDGNGEFKVNLPTHAFNIEPNEYLRFTLVDFQMYKNFYNVNLNNNCLMVSGDNGSTFEEVRLTPKNYKNYNEIVQEVADQLVASTTFTGFTASVDTSTLGTDPQSTGDRIMKITLTKSTHGLTPVIQARDYTDTAIRGGSFSRDHNDSYALLGGKRILTDTSATAQSFSITNNTGDIVIEGFFPVQRSTMEHLYLRTDLANDNFATKSFDASVSNHDIQMTHSDILGKMAIQNEFVSYTELSGAGAGYFADIFRKNMSSIKFRLTDHKRRAIPEVSADQDTLGNNNFTLTLRVEKYAFPEKSPIQRPVPENIKSNSVPPLLERRRIPF